MWGKWLVSYRHQISTLWVSQCIWWPSKPGALVIDNLKWDSASASYTLCLSEVQKKQANLDVTESCSCFHYILEGFICFTFIVRDREKNEWERGNKAPTVGRRCTLSNYWIIAGRFGWGFPSVPCCINSKAFENVLTFCPCSLCHAVTQWQPGKKHSNY